MNLYTARPRGQTEQLPQETRLISAEHIALVEAAFPDCEVSRASDQERDELRAAGVRIEALT